jgi:hypothetical protein
MRLRGGHIWRKKGFKESAGHDISPVVATAGIFRRRPA